MVDISAVKSVRGVTSIWIEKSERRKVFHCPTCRSPLFVYHGNLITIMPGDAVEKMRFPIEVHCLSSHPKYGKCKEAYVIDGITA